jgi:hypothetical protein
VNAIHDPAMVPVYIHLNLTSHVGSSLESDDSERVAAQFCLPEHFLCLQLRTLVALLC